MSETKLKHTPGPWIVFHKHKYNEWHVSVPTPGKNMRLGLFDNGIQTDNPEADARLIAAAPALLEAAEEVLKQFPCCRCPFETRKSSRKDIGGCEKCPLGHLKAAVEKAKRML